MPDFKRSSHLIPVNFLRMPVGIAHFCKTYIRPNKMAAVTNMITSLNHNGSLVNVNLPMME